jgi:hypothetical protein
MNSASRHVSERVLQLLGRKKIIAIIFPLMWQISFKLLIWFSLVFRKRSNRRRMGSLTSDLSGGRSPPFFKHMSKQQDQWRFAHHFEKQEWPDSGMNRSGCNLIGRARGRTRDSRSYGSETFRLRSHRDSSHSGPFSPFGFELFQQLE